MNRYVLVEHPHGYPCIGFDETVDVEDQTLHVIQLTRREYTSPWARRAISILVVFQLAHILMSEPTMFRVTDAAFAACGYFGVMVVTRATPILVAIHYVYMIPTILVIAMTHRVHDPIELTRVAILACFSLLYPIGFGTSAFRIIDALEESGDGV